MATPTEDPSFTGFSTKGRGNGSPANRLSLATTRPTGIRMPAGTSSRFVSSLSMAMAEVATPEWV